MIQLESYKKKFDVLDKFGVKNINVDKSVVHRGPFDIFNKEKCKKKNSPPPLAAAILGTNNTSAPLPSESEFYNCWTDIDAQELYLNSKPTCYLILNKPGAGAYSLGEAISKKLNCVHLCPKNVILDEMEQKSPTGISLDFNMKHNNVCKFDEILSIMKNKLASPAVQHRGYVISGIPLVTSSRSLKYLFNTLYGEESVLLIEDLLHDLIFNLKKKAKKAKEQTGTPHSSVSSVVEVAGEEEQEEEQEQEDVVDDEQEEEEPVVLPKFLLDSSFDIILNKKTYYDTKYATLLKQFQELMNLKMAPDVIIYITCPDIDLVTKKNHKFLNYTNNQNTMKLFTTKVNSEIRWPTRYKIGDYASPYDSHIFNPKYNCRQPINFIEQSIEQMCNYKRCILSLIEKKLKDFDPKMVIKLDARTTVHEMIHHVTERLILMPVNPVHIPEPLYLEEPPEDLEEFWKSVEDLNVIRSGVVSFNRYMSPWSNRCPVELKNRQSVKGNPKFATLLFKHVYLLSSLEAMILFCRNPRPYLKLKYLEPTCRIIVIGTKSSGKTLISESLSWIFDTPVICYKKFLEFEKQKKYNTFAKTILSEIIATIEDTRFADWQSSELDRYSKLETWCDSAISMLREYIPFLIESFRYVRILKPEIMENKEALEGELLFEAEQSVKEEEKPSYEFLSNYEYLRNELSFLLPILNDVEQCNRALTDRHFILQFAPINLTKMTEKPGIPVLGDKDVTEAVSNYIVLNDLQQEIQPITEELMNEMIRILSTIDTTSKNATNFEQSYGKFIIDGFPSDPEFWGYLADSKLLPDNTIALIENKEIEFELIKQYMKIDKCIKNYHERYGLANDPLIKTKLLTAKIPDSKIVDMQIIVQDSIDNTLDHIFLENDVAETNPDSDFVTSFNESIEKFREDWDSLKLKLEENSKSFIEVELETKSDIQIIEEVLLKLRKSYFIACASNEEEADDQEEEYETPRDVITYNNPKSFCETNIYCPIAYYDYGVLWEGKPELSVKYDNKVHYFCKEECSVLFQNDVTKYQSYNTPYKKLPPLRICIVGCVGSGKTTVSKQVAKELGLLHINFSEIVNDCLMPKHFKKVGRRYENPFSDVPMDDEAVVEFQIDEENENLVSDILSNETELRRMMYNYFERGTPIIPVLMQKLIKKLWFDKPSLTTGFVLDGYPRLPNDVEDMMACFCVPDLIIELESSGETALERLSPIMFKTWKTQLNEAKKIARMKLDNERKEWMNSITKNIVAKLIYDEILENMFYPIDEPVKSLSAESVIIDANPKGSSNVDANLFNTYNEMVMESPEPVDQSEWEKPDEAHERIDARIESLYEVDDENIQTFKETLAEQKIKVVSIDGTKPLNKVFRVALFKLSNLQNRCESFFEQTYVIDADIAEMLLLEGFYFLSKFRRMCPTYIFENPHVIINPYKISKRKGKVFPIVHRAHIYFVNGEENVRKFRTNPLKYIDSNALTLYFEYPLRISVIGAPKSGKSTLAEKLAKRYGLICISRGKAVRKILENFHWTELASKMISLLRQGAILDSDLIMKAVQTVAVDHRTVTHGFVFDGFPDSSAEAMKLTKDGLYPNIVFDISSNKDTTLRNSQDEIYNDIIKIKPPYSASFIENRFTKWSETSYKVRDWINNDYQNLYVLYGNQSKWQCLQDTNNIINNIIRKINYYLSNVNSSIVPVDGMCISGEIFQKRMSNFKNMCPVCLRSNILKYSGYPVDRKGVVQYMNMFYWVCVDHMNMVLKHPHCYLSAQKVDIPEIPAVVKRINVSIVYENGVCIVTYAENLPSQKIVLGSRNHAASFQRKTYLFCSEKCLEKFLAKPHMYCDIVVFKETNIFPRLELKKLPNIGYLEQTIGSILTDACCSVNVARPKYPGLEYPLSGLLYIALYLKTHDPLIDKTTLAMNEKAFRTYVARCKLIIDVGLRLRSMDNPFAKYPKCCRGVKVFDSGTVRKPSNTITSSTGISMRITEIDK